MLNPLKQGFQRAVGISRVFSREDLAERCHVYAKVPYYRLRSEYTFQSGWYMLSVSIETKAIGHDLKISGNSSIAIGMPGAVIAHLLLGSHTKSKRLIFLDSSQRQLYASIDTADSQVQAPAIEITRVSQKFAIDRMKKKLKFAGSNTDFEHSEQAAEIYQEYCQLMERHVQAVDYEEWLSKRHSNSASTGHQESAAYANERPIISLLNIDRKTTHTHLSQLQKNSVASSRRALIVVNPEISSASDSNNLRVAQLPGKDSISDKDGGAGNEQVGAPTTQTKSSDYLLISGFDLAVADGALDVLLGEIEANPECDLIYGDHDMLSDAGVRHSPVFKPEWNPDLLSTGNYIGRFFLVSRRLYEKVGGWDSSAGDSAHFDFLLRISPFLCSTNVTRIAQILFHRYSERVDSAPYLSTGQKDKEVLNSFLKARNQQSSFEVVNGTIAGSLRVVHPLYDPSPRVDIIIPSKDKIEVLDCCIQSILATTDYAAYRILIVDNGSVEPRTQEYYQSLRAHECIEVISFAGEFNYSAINNYAVSKCDAEVLVLLNNDTEVCNAEWLREMVSQAIRPEIGCVGAKLYYSNNLVQHAGVIVGLKGVAGHAHRFSNRDAEGYCGRLQLTHNVMAVTAACLAVRREVYNEVNGLDAVNLKVAYNDVDFCLRVHDAGYLNLWSPHSELYHHESLSRGSDDTSAKARRFKSEFRYMQTRWNTANLQDPSYNPNLANDQEDFSLAA